MKSFKLPFKTDSESLLLILSYVVFALSLVHIFARGKSSTALLIIGTSLILYSITRNVAISLLSGVVVGYIALYTSRNKEGFENEEEGEEEKEEKEAFEEETKTKPKKKRVPPPDNRDRAEMFELGKKYKAPKEEDDAEFHLDAGTTFLNAYKSLKPDQVAAMTKDTQDLMTTQKQLMTTLHTLKPLIKDGKDMMEMFQGYFGAGAPSGP